MVRLTRNSDACASAGSQDDGKDNVVPDSGAIDSFGHGKTVGVIGNPDFALQRPA
jgi:hypothetical protein